MYIYTHITHLHVLLPGAARELALRHELRELRLVVRVLFRGGYFCGGGRRGFDYLTSLGGASVGFGG